jgi:hypothetical protein
MRFPRYLKILEEKDFNKTFDNLLERTELSIPNTGNYPQH